MYWPRRNSLSAAGASEADWGALLAAAQQGDMGAYRALLHSVLPFARAVARRTGAGPGEIEDIVQEALLTLHRVRHTYQPGRPVKPWLAAIVARRSIDALRKRGRLAAREISDDAHYETFADPAAKSQEQSVDAEALQRMMAQLTPKQKEAIDLVKLKGMSLAEASAASGQSVASLKVNIHRAMKRMRLAGAGSEL